jgi:uncharacterized membrane protein
VIVVLQWLHVLFGVFWFGSQLYFDLTVRPAAARLDEAARVEFDRQTGTGRARQITVVAATGTVLLGFLRGVVGGVVDVLGTPYGITWLAALGIGTFMMLSVWTRGFGGRVSGILWNGLFFVIFSLMIAMRFGY